MELEPISVTCSPVGESWSCVVRVGLPGNATEHEVTVSTPDLAAFAPGHAEPNALVEQSFRFLLEREPKESILRQFALPVIGRYFPDYPVEIRRRLGSG